jgi:hypothetical protein
MSNPLTSLITGLLLSAGLSLFFYFGILITYHYLPGSVLLPVCLIVIFSLLFWTNIKYDHMLDLNDVFSKTISFDMKISTGFAGFFLRFMRPLTPYIGAVITLAVILLLLWGVPALIIYLVIYPGPAGTLLIIGVFCLSSGTCISYFYSNKDAFPSVADKTMFFIGILCGTAGVISILS